jgi:hypothetical protein
MTNKNPNIVLIMTDNQPNDAVGCCDNNEIYEEHQGDDGVLRINNQFRFVTATPL